uniref:SFRICE_033155 n=1 Tax=Spodoptera frugiperda TaxID=7108 RepID=A0A2H1V9K7_SPOFR
MYTEQNCWLKLADYKYFIRLVSLPRDFNERSVVVGLEIIITVKILSHRTKADDIFDCTVGAVAGQLAAVQRVAEQMSIQKF